MKTIPYKTRDQIWIRDQTARILHRHVLAGKHWRLDVDALRVYRPPAQTYAPLPPEEVVDKKPFYARPAFLIVLLAVVVAVVVFVAF